MIGIYFLKQKDTVVYVGQSIDIKARVKQHKKTDKIFDNYAHIECTKRLLDCTEMAYIAHHRPKYNIVGIDIAVIKSYSVTKIKSAKKKFNGMVSLTKEVKKKLKRVADRLDMPMAQVINMLLNKWLEENK